MLLSLGIAHAAVPIEEPGVRAMAEALAHIDRDYDTVVGARCGSVRKPKQLVWILAIQSEMNRAESFRMLRIITQLKTDDVYVDGVLRNHAFTSDTPGNLREALMSGITALERERYRLIDASKHVAGQAGRIDKGYRPKTKPQEWCERSFKAAKNSIAKSMITEMEHMSAIGSLQKQFEAELAKLAKEKK